MMTTIPAMRVALRFSPKKYQAAIAVTMYPTDNIGYAMLTSTRDNATIHITTLAT
jgi:hypothetical protein